MRAAEQLSGGTLNGSGAQRASEPRLIDTTRRPGIRILHVVLGIGVVALLFLSGRELASVVPRALEIVRDLGPWAAVAFILFYAVATVAWIPGSLLTLAAGALFGLAAGTAWTLLGATLGAALAFLVSRHLARDAVERRLGSHPKLAAVDRAVAQEGRKVVLLLRLSPVFPFAALNYILGLTSIRFRDYLPASLVGMAPGTFMYVYAGYAAGEVAGGVAGAGKGTGYYVMLALGLLATLAVTVVVTRTAQQALRRHTAIENGAAERRGGEH